MGDFRVELNFVGGHGCDRKAQEGQRVDGCGKLGCPDCEIRAFVRHMTATNTADFKGGTITITHWPGQPCEVVDDVRPASHPTASPFVVRFKGSFS